MGIGDDDLTYGALLMDRDRERLCYAVTRSVLCKLRLALTLVCWANGSGRDMLFLNGPPESDDGS